LGVAAGAVGQGFDVPSVNYMVFVVCCTPEMSLTEGVLGYSDTDTGYNPREFRLGQSDPYLPPAALHG
jgi:hypothetical protein